MRFGLSLPFGEGLNGAENAQNKGKEILLMYARRWQNRVNVSLFGRI